jgi:ATP-dependent protease ClpP protease subunit
MNRSIFQALMQEDSDTEMADEPMGGAHNIQAIENDTLYFYGDVSQESALAFLSQLQRMERAKFRANAAQDAECQLVDEWRIERHPIRLRINSYGGELFAGFAIADALPKVKVQTVSVIEGICASAATLIAMSAYEVTMRENAAMLIHQHSGWFTGNYEQFKDAQKLNEILIQRIVNFYVKHTKLDAEAIREMLKRDYWMDAQEALEKGFVDRII